MAFQSTRDLQISTLSSACISLTVQAAHTWYRNFR